MACYVNWQILARSITMASPGSGGLHLARSASKIRAPIILLRNSPSIEFLADCSLLLNRWSRGMAVLAGCSSYRVIAQAASGANICEPLLSRQQTCRSEPSSTAINAQTSPFRCAVRISPFEDCVKRVGAFQGAAESLDFGVSNIALSISSMVSTPPMVIPKLASTSGGNSMMTSPLPSEGSWHFILQRWGSVITLFQLLSWRAWLIMLANIFAS
ncbi:hypothetical protein SAMN04489798_0271 [Pseudomonas arsenicoxydans]|uniref:Uncharacterized protein n=1 Tax=Pseudomonas arsenicoxydans TaxID=702115 RepID=A0A1H0B9U7_9PSED|nr:hypothetical protein SAMN04489798_0271 [Pseudomonas arsenicoxydans]